MFVPINGYEKYYTINEEGEVYSKYRKRLLIPTYTNGYLTTELCVDGLRKRFRIHRLIAIHFIPNPNNYTIIDHIDRNKLNNSIKNLRWTTYSINNRNSPNRTEYPNIRITKYGNYQVQITLDNKNVYNKNVYNKTFKTLDEALSERDCAFDFYGIENHCYS